MTLRSVFAPLIALLLLFAGIQPASTHATLTSAEPRDGAMLAAAPSELVLTFNEPVAPLVFTLVAPDGTSDTPAVETAERIVRLRPTRPLADGTSILSWRVVSADGHPVAGSMTFSVRVRTATSGAEANVQSPSLRMAIWTCRVLIYIGLFIGIGGVFFLCWSDAKIDFRRGSAVALSAGFVALMLSLALVGLDALGRPLSGLVAGEVWRAGYATSFGLTASIATVGFAVGFAALLIESQRLARIASAAAVVCAALALASSGHASAAPPQALMRPSVFIHAAAVALWAGSLAPLLLSLGSDVRGTTALRRFSAVAPYVVAALVGSGVALAIVQIAQPAALWESAYGNVFSLKMAAILAIAPLAIFNRFILTPRVIRGSRKARRQMRGMIAAELTLALIIFGLVGLWRFTPPPRALAPSQSAFVHLHSDTMMANVTLSGPSNELRVQLARPDFSPLAAKEVTVRLANQNAGIEPITRKATPTNGSDWLVTGLVLPHIPGWAVEVDALVSDFDKLSIKGPLVFGPASAEQPEDNAFVHLHGAQAMADVTISPGRAGLVRITLRLSHEDYSPVETRRVAFTLAQPGRDDLNLPVRPGTEPGEWRAGPTSLPVAGLWTVKISVTLPSGAEELLDGPIVLEPARPNKQADRPTAMD
jgi:copper transport protein